jgi:uncharacterized ion transporter superfamily protein YfcC
MDTKKSKKNQKDEIKFTKKTLILIFIIVILLALSIFIGRLGYENYQSGKIKNYCENIQNDPNLQYPCTCIPYTDKSHLDEEIIDKMDIVCICECQISQNQTITWPVAKAK